MERDLILSFVIDEHVPALLTEEQAKGWKKSVDAVHAKGGYIYAQLWYAFGTHSALVLYLS